MSAIDQGSTQASRSYGQPQYLTNADPGFVGTSTASDTIPTLQQWENIFGPAARDIKQDSQRHKRHQRWHLPDALKGVNMYLTDRVDGLITDATNSPFTSSILPYVYMEAPDQKIKWNVYNFDEGIASRVPYESAARVLPQSKRSFQGYIVRHGLAIAMEHNFMVSPAGRENFKNQLLQLVGSIQMTNDLDVHQALLTAPSYQKFMDERYIDNTKTFAQQARLYTDLFGMMQKIPNALDWLIEDAKTHLKTWGSQPPTFMLCNNALTTQLTMIPERTDYFTNGPDGLKRLKQGPELPSYRGLQIVNSRKFSMEAGTMPRDMLRRRVRVCQHYNIQPSASNTHTEFEFYDEDRDAMFRLKFADLLNMATPHDVHHPHIDEELWEKSKLVAPLWCMALQIPRTLLYPEMADMGIDIKDQIAAFFETPDYAWLTHPEAPQTPCVTLTVQTATFQTQPINPQHYLHLQANPTPIHPHTKKVKVALHIMKLFVAICNNIPCPNFWKEFGINSWDEFAKYPHNAAKLNPPQALPDNVHDINYFTRDFQQHIYLHHSKLNVSMSDILEFKTDLTTLIPGLSPAKAMWFWSTWALINCSQKPSMDTLYIRNAPDYFKRYMTHSLDWTRYHLLSLYALTPYLTPSDVHPINNVFANDGHTQMTQMVYGMKDFYTMIFMVVAHLNDGTMTCSQDWFNYALGFFADNINGMRDEILQKMGTIQDATSTAVHPAGTHFNPIHDDLILNITGVSMEDVGVVVVRPNIEHEMLAIIMGRGGTQELGATFWGQTELSCYDDSQHGIWGMSYKYHARAFVTNERNLIRAFDVSFDGYNGGLDNTYLDWTNRREIEQFVQQTNDRSKPYTGKSMLVMLYPKHELVQSWPNPVLWSKSSHFSIPDRGILVADDAERHMLYKLHPTLHQYLERNYLQHVSDIFHPDTSQAADKTLNDETSSVLVSYEGYLGKYPTQGHHSSTPDINHGTGHLGRCFQGVASIRMGRGQILPRGPVNMAHIV